MKRLRSGMLLIMSMIFRSMRPKSPLSLGIGCSLACHQPVVHLVAEPLAEILFPRFADGIHDVVALVPFVEKLGQKLRRILQIVIHNDDGVARGVLEPAEIATCCPKLRDRLMTLIRGSRAQMSRRTSSE